MSIDVQSAWFSLLGSFLNVLKWMVVQFSVADLHRQFLDALTPFGPIIFIFMQLLGNLAKWWAPYWEILDPSLVLSSCLGSSYNFRTYTHRTTATLSEGYRCEIQMNKRFFAPVDFTLVVEREGTAVSGVSGISCVCDLSVDPFQISCLPRKC